VRRLLRPSLGRVEALVIALLSILLVGQWWFNRRVDLLDYPEQRVVSRLPGFDEPAALYAGPVVVSARKCVTGDEPIPLIGVLSWVSSDPMAAVIEINRGATIRQPEPCVERTYINEVPQVIVERSNQMLALAGGSCTRWQVTGNETPDDRRIQPQTWVTEPFWLCRE
jgi:hypothetical protein